MDPCESTRIAVSPNGRRTRAPIRDSPMIRAHLTVTLRRQMRTKSASRSRRKNCPSRIHIGNIDESSDIMNGTGSSLVGRVSNIDFRKSGWMKLRGSRPRSLMMPFARRRIESKTQNVAARARGPIHERSTTPNSANRATPVNSKTTGGQAKSGPGLSLTSARGHQYDDRKTDKGPTSRPR